MRLRIRHVLLALAVLALVGVVAALPLFLPERATESDESLATLGDPDDVRILRTGTFEDGAPGHHVAGMIHVLATPDGHVLRFVDYEQTQGPDVHVYLTRAPGWDKATVEAGLRVRIDGGADDGESTRTGTLHQALPADFRPDTHHGVAIWCDRFDVLFGSAVLGPT